MEQAEFALALQHDSSFPGWVNFHFLGDIPPPPSQIPQHHSHFEGNPLLYNSSDPQFTSYTSLYLLITFHAQFVIHEILLLGQKYLGEIGVKRPGSKELSKYILSNELSWKIAFWCFPWVNGMKNSKNNIILSNEMQKYPRYKACFSTEFEKKSIHIYFLPFDKFLKSVWNISCYDKNCREIIISFY